MYHVLFLPFLSPIGRFFVFILVPQEQNLELIQPSITCSKLTIETLEQGVKYVQS